MTRIKHLENKGFFIFDDDEKETLAELTYKKNGDILIFDHTYVSDKLRNQGIAGKLLNTAVIYARENKLGKKSGYSHNKIIQIFKLRVNSKKRG